MRRVIWTGHRRQLCRFTAPFRYSRIVRQGQKISKKVSVYGSYRIVYHDAVSNESMQGVVSRSYSCGRGKKGWKCTST